jgi:hypothetical protein
VKIGEAPKEITVGEFLDKIKQDVPAEAKQIESTNTPQCVMCEYAMSILEKRLLTNSTEVCQRFSPFYSQALVLINYVIRKRLQEPSSFCVLIFLQLLPTCASILSSNMVTSFLNC